MASVSLALSLYSYVAPLRVGFVFITNYNTLVTGLSDPSVAVNNAFHYFIESKGAKEAMQFLVKSFVMNLFIVIRFYRGRSNANEFVSVRNLYRI